MKWFIYRLRVVYYFKKRGIPILWAWEVSGSMKDFYDKDGKNYPEDDVDEEISYWY